MSETWAMTLRIVRVLGRLHHSLSRRLMVQQSRIGRDGGWLYPLLAEAMAEAGLK